MVNSAPASSLHRAWRHVRLTLDDPAPATAKALAARVIGRERIFVLALDCEEAAALRALSPLLPDVQSWTFLASDTDFHRARRNLTAWADAAELSDAGLQLTKGPRRIAVVSLAGMFAGLDITAFNLVVAWGESDRMTRAAINEIARRTTEAKALFYAGGVYVGRIGWTPRHPNDRALVPPFHSKLMVEQAVGATAAAEWTDQLQLAGYAITEDATTLRLNAIDDPLVQQLAQLMADAALDRNAVPKRDVAAWLARPKAAVEIDHVDIFAAPA